MDIKEGKAGVSLLIRKMRFGQYEFVDRERGEKRWVKLHPRDLFL